MVLSLTMRHRERFAYLLLKPIATPARSAPFNPNTKDNIMSKIGEIRQINKEGRTILEGFINTIDLDLSFVFTPVLHRLSDGAPNYRIDMVKDTGQVIQIGSAWTKKYTDHGQDKELISITIDDPSFTAPLHVAAFKDSDDCWAISFRRRQIRNQK
jgi:uncharacterized protein (DUF736 family)